jgi:monoamine oxidase
MNTHFAGEHVADWQGFMEGAINTGEDAAATIL